MRAKIEVMETDQAERLVLRAIDAAFDEAVRRAPGLIVCRAGCDSCCKRQPFSITQADALRLAEGMRLLEGRDPAVAGGIRDRAARYLSRIEGDFPGDWEAQTITPNPEWREWFYGRHKGLACPVLDPEKGGCLLHEHRPVCCRLYGPLIRIGGAETSGPCELNYAGLAPMEVDLLGVNVDLPELAEAPEPETMIVFAVAG